MNDSLQDQLAWCRTLRQIHVRDSIEIEELYRTFVYPELPRRPGREKFLADLIGTSVSEAIYILESLHAGLRVKGDICEFGVAQGATSQLLASEIIDTDRDLYLFDSFEGLPAPSKEDILIDDIFNLGSMDRYQGTMMSPENEVRDKLRAIPFPERRTRIMKGWVKDTLKQSDAPAKVAFAYIDFDFYEPIKTTLEYLHHAMPVGGRMVVDDYGFFSKGAQVAVDEFVAAFNEYYELKLPLAFAGKFALIAKIKET